MSRCRPGSESFNSRVVDQQEGCRELFSACVVAAPARCGSLRLAAACCGSHCVCELLSAASRICDVRSELWLLVLPTKRGAFMLFVGALCNRQRVGPGCGFLSVYCCRYRLNVESQSLSL